MNKSSLIAFFALLSIHAVFADTVKGPPSDAPSGKEVQGVRIGLWSEKKEYKEDERINVWILARKERGSSITVGVGGNLYVDSEVFVYSRGQLIKKFGIGGGIDGNPDPTFFAGGVSGRLKELPVGEYELVWKTRTHRSNKISITISANQAKVATP